MLIDVMKDRLKKAMLSKNEVEKNILRVVIGEVQQKNFSKDEDVQRVARKVMESNCEVLAALPDGDARKVMLGEENRILSEILPRVLSESEVLAILFDVTDQIKMVKSEGQATGIAMKILKTVKDAAIDGNVVKAVVMKMRENT